jgi:hypothetical protein
MSDPKKILINGKEPAPGGGKKKLPPDVDWQAILKQKHLDDAAKKEQ